MPLVHLTAQLTLRRTDLFTSNALSRHPAAWLSDATKEILSPPEFLCQTERSLSNTNISNSSKLAAILSTFRCISSILESLPAANIERFDNEIYGDQVYHLQHELMTLSIDTDMAPPDISYDRSRVKYLATAALIYLHLVFFKAPAQSLIIQVMVERLHTIFDDSAEMSVNDETENAEVIWALTIGGIAASTPKEHQWFVKRLAEISITVSSVGQRQELSRITWHSVLNPPHDRLWKEVLIQH
jgi:hypothetical protein